MEQSIEVLSEPAKRGLRRRNRNWSVAEKARIVAETLELGATVNAVARRHGLQAHHLSSWRTLARNGKLVLPPAQDGTDFVPIIRDAKFDQSAAGLMHGLVAQGAAAGSGFVDVVFGVVTIRLDANVQSSRIAELARALNAGA